MKLLFFIVLFFLIFFSLKRFNDILNPIFINSIIWFGFTLIYEVFCLTSANYRKLSEQYYIYVFSYCIVFTIFVLFITRHIKKKNLNNRFNRVEEHIPIIDKLLLASVVFNAILIVRFFMITETINIGDAIQTMRIMSVEEENFFTWDVSFLIFLFNFSPLLLSYIFLYKVRIKKKYWLGILIVEMMLVALLLSTKGRIFRFSLLIMLLFLYSNVKRKKLLIGICAIAGCLGVFFLTSSRDSAFFQYHSWQDYLFLYLLSPLPALDRLLSEELVFLSDGFAARCGAFFYRVFNKIFGTEIPEYIDPGFIDIPLSTNSIQTNVFTLLGPYYMDFEFIGSVFCAIIYAIIFGYSYKLMSVKGRAFSVFYFINIPYLFLQFFGDFIIPTFSITIQEFLCAAIITYLAKKYPSLKVKIN